MKKILFEDALILNAIKTARFFFRILPARVSLAAARGFGRLAYVSSKRKKIAYKNLRAAFSREKLPSELKKIARRSMQSLAMSAVDLLKIPEMDKDYIDRHVQIHGMEKLEPYLKAGRGIIYLTAHFGSWELLNIAAGLKGYPMTALARVQKHPKSDAYLNRLRTSKGSQVIHKGMPVREILKSLKKGKMVGILSDQDGGRGGCFIRLFGRLSSMPSGAAKFSLKTGSPVFSAFIFRENGLNHRIEVEGPLRPPDAALPPAEAERHLLQQFADILESKIRRSPHEWLWAHRRWKSSPDRFILILSDGKAGHLKQSLGFADAIRKEMAARGLPAEAFHSKTIPVEFRSSAAKNLLRIFGVLSAGLLPFKNQLLKMVLSRDSYREIMSSYADIVVSAGDSLQELNLLAARENHAKSALLMKPHLPPGCFQAVIVPRHDGMKRGGNVFVTDGAVSGISEDLLKEEAEKFARDLRLDSQAKRIGVLIGGDTDRLKFDRAIFESVIRQLERASAESGALMLATSSRRTPAWADHLLKSILGNHPRCPLLVIANDANRSGTVPAILGLSNLLVVTGESMSMVSEAMSSGRPVIVFMPDERARLKKKYQEFLNESERSGLIQKVDSKNFESVLKNYLHNGRTGFQTEHPMKNHEVLREAARRVI